jgi:hypothetical protein
MYFLESISEQVKCLHMTLKSKLSRPKKIILVAFFSGFAAIFQSAGGFLPGVGYLISPLSTAPILFCSIISVSFGLYSYMLTILLLFVLQPSELLVFPFTTGILGLGIGSAFYYLKRRIYIILSGAIILALGIINLLFIFKFPVLGPVMSTSFQLKSITAVFLFTIMYSWVWVEISYAILKRLKNFI